MDPGCLSHCSIPSPNKLSSPGPVLDIIVVRNLFDILRPSPEAWSWLEDLCKGEESLCRLFLHRWSPDGSQPRDICTEHGLYAAARGFLDDLKLLRTTDEDVKRPLIFICHGFGGLVVKSALALSFEGKVEMPWLFLSTYSVFFASTPHYGVSKAALRMILFETDDLRQSKAEFNHSCSKESDDNLARSLHARFQPLTNYVEAYHLWEQQPTTSGGIKAFIVEKHSAAPYEDRHHAEVIGIDATHKDVLTFQDRAALGFETVSRALKSCFRHASTRTSLRWRSWTTTEDSPPSSQTQGHKFQDNTISGGRAHFGDNITNVYMADGNDLSEAFGSSDRSMPSGMSPNHRKSSNLTRACSVDFTGRKEQLRMLKTHLGKQLGKPEAADPQEHSHVVILYGLGGAGKTELCLKFADQARHMYWGIFWIDASSRETAESGYCALGQMQGIGASFEASKFWLCSYPHPWLLILDNADDPTIKVAELVPQSVYGHVIITTRNQNVRDEFIEPFEIQLKGMEPEDAVDFLLVSAGRKPNDQERDTAKVVASEVGYLALALKLAGTAVRYAFESMATYLERYLGLPARLVSDNREFQEEANAIATWYISLERMGHDTRFVREDAMSLLAVLANLHFESIPLKIFRIAWLARQESSQKVPDFLGMETSAWQSCQARMLRAVHALHSYSIIDYDHQNRICALHPVVHRWARSQQKEGVDWGHWNSYTMGLLARCISPHLEPSNRAFRRSLLPHIKSCCSVPQGSGLGASQSENASTIQRLERFASVQAEAGQWKTALDLQQRVVAYRERFLGTSHRQTLYAKRAMSQMYWDSFAIGDAIRTRAEILATRTFSRPRWSDWRPIWPPRYLEYCIALDDLTQSLWLAGELGISQHIGQIAKDWFMDKLGPADPLTLTATLNLARTYSHLGRLEEARNLLEDNVRFQLRLFGKNHPDTLMAQNELGMVYLACKRFDDAEVAVIDVYQRRQDVLGEEHAYTLWSANDLAKVYFSREEDHEVYPRAAEAISLLESIIPVVERTLGTKHGGMVMTKGNLARAYVRFGKLGQAMAILEDIFLTVKEAHPSWAEIMTGKAEVQMRLGNLEGALESCQKVLRKGESNHGLQVPWIFQFTGPKEPVRSSDFQRMKVLKLMESIELARSTLIPGTPDSFRSAFTNPTPESN